MENTEPAQSPGPLSNQNRAAPLEFRNVTKVYLGSSRPAIANLSLEIPAGEICCIVGPSGGGKTTAMKLVNRLIDITEGDILIDGKSVREMDVTQLRRGIGYVIQQIGLFPHMTVNDNIATVPRLLGWDRARIRTRAAELLELVGLEPELGKRYPSQLSGGQRQRVGRDRALKRLSLHRLRDLDLLDVGTPNGQPRLPESTTLRDALSVMLTEGDEVVVTKDEDDTPTGRATIDLIQESM